jgi:tetrapyrrole methylase family protein/MazG family protein
MSNLIQKKNFKDLTKIIARLRHPVNGCPWDLKQTHVSLKKYLREEMAEVLEAIDEYQANGQKDPEHLIEELGDLLLQIMLHSQLISEKHPFDVTAVVDGIAKKMVRRHPHVFGKTKVKNTQDVIDNWKKIKKQEKKQKQEKQDKKKKKSK